MAKPSHDPEPYSSPPPFPLFHITSEPQPLTTDSPPSPPFFTPTSSSKIIQSDNNPIRYRPYRVQNPRVAIINLSTNKDCLKEVEENIYWRKKVSRNAYHCKLCHEKDHMTNNCWTFKYRFCYDKAPRHWSWKCLKKPSGSAPIPLITTYDNTVAEI